MEMNIKTLKEIAVKINASNPLSINGKEFTPKTKRFVKSFNIRDGIVSFVDEGDSLYTLPITNDRMKAILSANFTRSFNLYVPFCGDSIYECEGYKEVFGKLEQTP